MSNFKINHLKGKFAEDIAIYHFESMDFKVIKTGKEELYSKELSNVANKHNNKRDFQNNSNYIVFKIFNDVLSKLPDLLIYKEADNFMIKFVEVKYRKIINQNNLKNFRVDEQKDELDLKKYFDNLDRLYKLIFSDNKWPDIYVYLVTSDEIYFGKVYKNKDHYKVEFLTSQEVTTRFSKNWPNYKQIADEIKANVLVN